VEEILSASAFSVAEIYDLENYQQTLIARKV
jgi:hypothetical protein